MFNPDTWRPWLPIFSLLAAVMMRLVARARRRRPLRRRMEALVRKHPVFTALAGGLILMLVRAAMLPVLPMPVARVYDEFSYLLMADTFAGGHATNPSPPHWEHFETPFVQLTPTYQSAYPPVQGLMLAAGFLLGRHPWWGVLLEMGMFGAALIWMLEAWLPPRWMLLGALFALLQFGLASYWMNSYWGGAPAATGGALLLGAWPRLMRRSGAAVWSVYAIGLLLLANSRPWEGAAMAAAVSALMLFDLRRRMPKWRQIAPAAAIFVCGMLAAGWYFWRVTGSPFELPYQLAFRQYAADGVFFWQPMRHPLYHHRELEEFYTALALNTKSLYGTPAAIASITVRKLYAMSNFYAGPLILCVLLFLPALARNPRTGRVLIVCAAVILAMFPVTPFQIHYAAPICSAIVLLTATALRRIHLLRRRGWQIAAYLIPAAIFLVGGTAVLDGIGLRNLDAPTPRTKVWAELVHTGAKHLVFVRYAEPHPMSTEEWVYNDADLQRTPVVWARDMGAQKNLEVIHDYPDRQVWLAEPNATPPKISAYQP
jgi:hypothetical protein